MSAYAIPSMTCRPVSLLAARRRRDTDPERVHGQVVDRAILVLREVARDLQDVAQDCARLGRQLDGYARLDRET
jgi:hypothetical protein